MKEYKIIQTFGHSALSDEVNKAIKEGWEPIGGVTVSQFEFPTDKDREIIWAQAMTR